MPIALKYALITGFLLVLFMIVLGRSLLDLALEAADTQINDKGIKAALLVATRLEPFWMNENLSTEERRAAQVQLDEELQSCLRDPAAEGLLDILIMDTKGKEFYASAAAGVRVKLGDEHEISTPRSRRTQVKIVSGTVRGAGQTHPARSYERVLRQGSEPVGRVRVFLSSETIERIQKSHSDRATQIIFLAVAVAIVVVVLVGRWLTRPIRELKKDMAIVAAGDLRHQSNVRTGDEMDDLARAFNQMTSHLAEAQQREIERKSIERELSIATEIQQALLPEEIPAIPGFDVAAHYASAREVGGDYYDFISRGGERSAVVVADVSGKGIPGSLVMTMTRSLVRMAARDLGGPEAVLGRVNASLSRDMTRGMFVTLVFVDVDPGRSSVAIARAGHNPVLLYRAASRDIVAIQPPGIALGMDAGENFVRTLKIQNVDLGPGDFVALYTDGIVEAMNLQGEEYSPNRFARTLAELSGRSASDIVAGVIADVEKHAAGAEPSDDITLVIVKRIASAPGP